MDYMGADVTEILRGNRVHAGPLGGTDNMSLPDRPAWQDRAACDGRAEVDFFPESRGGEEHFAPKLEERFCRTCPVRVQCLHSAIEQQDYGIWAGTTTQQRRKLMRVRERVKCPLCENRTLVPSDDIDICLACGTSWRKRLAGKG